MYTGHADLRLCTGPVPHYRQIVRLGGALADYIIDEFGTGEFIRRLADPFWFQCFACVCGFEWQYSGATTVTLTALKEYFSGREEIVFLGGKGRKEETPEEARKAVRVDSRFVQDGYSVYFHMYVSDGETWAVVNQGMNERERLARRYHWGEVDNYVEEPQTIAGTPGSAVNVTLREHRELRRTVLDVLRDEQPHRIVTKILSLSRPPSQRTILEYVGAEEVKIPYHLRIPRRVSEKALALAREATRFEDLLNVPGLGESTVRGLVYVAHLVYGAPLSWRDPVVYTHAFGTKAKVPRPVERREMEKAADFLLSAIYEAKMGAKDKKQALLRLQRFTAPLMR